MDHIDGDEERNTGDMWQLEGPLTYMPTPFAVRGSLLFFEWPKGGK